MVAAEAELQLPPLPLSSICMLTFFTWPSDLTIPSHPDLADLAADSGQSEATKWRSRWFMRRAKLQFNSFSFIKCQITTAAASSCSKRKDLSYQICICLLALWCVFPLQVCTLIFFHWASASDFWGAEIHSVCLGPGDSRICFWLFQVSLHWVWLRCLFVFVFQFCWRKLGRLFFCQEANWSYWSLFFIFLV